MAKDQYQELESPFLDAEVLPPPAPADESSPGGSFIIPEVEDAWTPGADAIEPEADEEFSGESEFTDLEEGDAAFERDEVEPEEGGETSADEYVEPESDYTVPEAATIESEDDFGAEEFDLAVAEPESDIEAEWDLESASALEDEAAGVASAEGIDDAAAQILFPPAVKNRLERLLDATHVADAATWNAARHPAVSGISLSALRARLEQYVDATTVENAMRGNSALKERAGDRQAVLAVLAHQFQQKIYASPKQHDGRIGEGTLDALGFVRHRGDALNFADTANVAFHVKGNSKAFRRLQELYASDPGAFADLGEDVKPATWFRLFVTAPFLGRPFVRGIHVELMRRLRKAEAWLVRQPAYEGMSPVQLGKALGIDEDHRGGRAKNNNSMHTLGLAVDIGYVKNPWVAGQFDPSGNASQNRNIAFHAVTRNVSRLMTGTEEVLSAAWLHALGANVALTTETAHAEVQRRHANLQEYLGLENDAARLKTVIQKRAATTANESLDAAVTRWRDTIRSDRAKLKHAFGARNPANGFMNHHRDLVVALRDHGCLAWGAIDLGKRASGDMMHFDCRATGIGWKLSLPAQRTAGANHPCAAKKTTTAPPKPSAKTATPVRATGDATDFLGGRLWTFASRTLPMRVGVFCPKAVASARGVDVLLYAHGLLSPCQPVPVKVPRDLITERPFELGSLVDASNRPIVLVVPFMDWSNVTRNKLGFGRNNRQHRLGQPANVNALIAEVLAEIGRISGSGQPELLNLILSGHSRAYDFLDPLAHAHADPEMSKGALARLSRVWALDTTYHCDINDWTRWLAAKPALRVDVFYRDVAGTTRCGDAFKAAVPTSGGRLTVTVASESHCAVPKRRLPSLLALPVVTTPEVEDEFAFREIEPELDETFAGDSEADIAPLQGFTFEEPEETEGESGMAYESPVLDEHAEECEHELDAEAESDVEDESVEHEDTDTAKTVNVIVDQPGESDDKYQLVSTDGKYSKTLGAAHAKPLTTGETLLTFSGVNPKKTYKLIHVRSAGSKRVVLPDMPFSFLTAAGKKPQTARHTYVTLPSQVPAKLPDRYGMERDVDPILAAASPQLLDLAVEDPKL